MKITQILNIVVSLLIFTSCQPHIKKGTPEPKTQTKVILGIDNFLQNYVTLVKNKKVGLVTNPSGVTGNLLNTANVLSDHPVINLVVLFGPEHGVYGNHYAGDKIADEIDNKTGIQLYSLYGKNRKPTKSMIESVDIMLFDIQDIGIRSYTYIYTMALVMQACAEYGKPIIVFDRPNPLGGIKVEGNILEEKFKSFVGLYQIPYLYGMTIGELAQLFNNEFEIHCDLKVIPMIGWKREMLWEDTKLHWVPTSPHVPEWQTVFYLGATGTFGELHTISEGVGYTTPFRLVGAPWFDSKLLAKNLNQLNLQGIYFRPTYFKPFYGPFKGEMCQGVQLHITSYQQFKPYITGLHIIQTVMKLYPEHDLFVNPERVKMFNKVVGTDKIMVELKNGTPVSEIEKSWQDELNKFKKIREKYLLY